MYSRLRLARKYLHYYTTASNGKGHGVHSPFVFELITRILNDRRDFPQYARIEALRRRLLKDDRILDVVDLGAGSAVGKGGSAKQRSVSAIARHAAKPRKWGQLLFRIARYYQPRTMLELGTSLGISTAYLASGAGMNEPGLANGGIGRSGEEGAGKDMRRGGAGTRLLTIEGSPAVAAVAADNFRSLGLENIELVAGGFDERLASALEKLDLIDLAFVDGNHQKAPTLRYFDLLMGRVSSSAVLIFDDIHWSAEMEEAWEDIKRDPRVLLTVDFFFIGLVFVREAFKVKQHFTIRF